jgi:Ca-activated chloride channel homolog
MSDWFSLRYFSPAVWGQFTFQYPLALLGGPVVILLLAGLRYLLHRNQAQRLGVSFALSPDQWSDRLLSLGRYLPVISMLVGLGLLLVALARPQIVREVREDQSAGIDMILAVDVSSSMLETDLKPTRLDAARRVARVFVAGRPNDRIGLVAFAGEARSLCPLTTDYDLLNQYLDQLSDHLIPTAGTAVGDALARCINRLRSTTGKTRIVILLSDGDNTAGNLDPLTAARLARQFGIRLYTIAVGRVNSPVAPSTIRADPTMAVDENTLQRVAALSNGRYFRATDTGQLRGIFGEIDRLEKAPVRTRVYQDVQDFYRPYLYWGIVWLLLVLALKSTIFSNVLED